MFPLVRGSWMHVEFFVWWFVSVTVSFICCSQLIPFVRKKRRIGGRRPTPLGSTSFSTSWTRASSCALRPRDTLAYCSIWDLLLSWILRRQSCQCDWPKLESFSLKRRRSSLLTREKCPVLPACRHFWILNWRPKVNGIWWILTFYILLRLLGRNF